MPGLATEGTEAAVSAWQTLLFEDVGRFNPEVAVALPAIILVLVHVSSVELSLSPRGISISQLRVVWFAVGRGFESSRFRSVGGCGMVVGLPWPLRKQDSVRVRALDDCLWIHHA